MLCLAVHHLGLHSACQVLQVVSLAARTYQLQDNGLEIFFSGRASLYLTLPTSRDRNTLQQALLDQPALRLQQARPPEKWRKDWCRGKVGPIPGWRARFSCACLHEVSIDKPRGIWLNLTGNRTWLLPPARLDRLGRSQA